MAQERDPVMLMAPRCLKLWERTKAVGMLSDIPSSARLIDEFLTHCYWLTLEHTGWMATESGRMSESDCGLGYMQKRSTATAICRPPEMLDSG